MSRKNATFDEIGVWSEIKLAIVKEYASAYSTILAKQQNLYHIYIDGFAGRGVHISKRTGQFVPGSPLNAMNVVPPFREFYLIDLDGNRVSALREVVGQRPDVHLSMGDCNEVLLKDVFPNVRYEDYRRALCILDPYGLHLDWEVIKKAGELGTIDMFLNFPVLDMNRNVLWRNPDGVTAEDRERMTRFWGDESWVDASYNKFPNLFGDTELEKETNDAVARAFQKRLKEFAKFKRVPDPMPMRNSNGGTVYYLFFASQKDTAENIVKDIFDKYRTRGLTES